ncbi:MAG: tRNA (guanosine(46)-N7)-methyltransferase TrmB [Kiloniellales bacterium]
MESPLRRHLHGRRKGRPLRGGMKLLLEAELERRAITLPREGETLDPRALFATPPADVWLEIGFGGGEHLAWQAAENPEVGILGAEIFLNGVAKALRALTSQESEAVRIYTGDARDLLDCLQPASLARAFILFPDPWPKARHNKRRIVQPETLDRLAALLQPGAELRLGTDDPDYAAWMLSCLDRHPEFAWPVRRAAEWRQRPADWPATRYEQKALAAGRKPVFMIWRRR